MTPTEVGVVSPGAMGAAVGADLVALGHRVVWASDGRSAPTRSRAEEAGLTDVADLAALFSTVEVVLSICPPADATHTAGLAADAGFAGTYVDANAVSPATSSAIGEVVGASARYVDGGIIGGPPRAAGIARLHLAGHHAPEVAALFAGGRTSVHVLEAPPPAASALKMAYAAWTKGSTALLLTARALAAAGGVEEALLEEWGDELRGRSERSAAGAAPKAWRWVAEMDEIAASAAEHGLPDGFHRAAADVYRALAHRKGTDAPEVADLLADLLAADPGA